jgi:hypothetical protein
MLRLLFVLPILLLGCKTTTPVEVTKEVVQAPIKTVVYIGENGQRTIVNYYGTLEELNKDNKTDQIHFFKLEF